MSRKGIFDAIRSALGGTLSQANVTAIDALLDDLGVARDGNGFARALAFVLSMEGGYVNHPRDPGGRTNLGVTQRTWEAWTGKPASEAVMRGLTPADVKPLYKRNYWDAVRGDDLPPAVALLVFDMAVNAGPTTAARLLQDVVGAARDGVIGPLTIEAANRQSIMGMITRYSDRRMKYYKSLPTFKTFGAGWTNRVDQAHGAALELL